LPRLGAALRESLEQTRAHALLVYVDVIEFDGQHLRQFYEGLTHRFEQYLKTERGRRSASLIRDGLSPLTAMQITTRFLVKYFEVEVLFGVDNHYGRENRDVLCEMADVLRHGLLKDPLKP
jgi:hypothetical protein